MESALDPECTRRFEAWLRDADCGTAWLTGAPGSGMTTMTQTATRGLEAVWLTPATLRSRAFIRDVCSNATAVNGKRKVLVLDEFDAVLGNEAAMQDLSFTIKRCGHVPVVCVMKATRAALTCDLRSKAALVVDFPVPTLDAMEALVTRVAAEEGLDCSRVAALCQQVPGDVRHVLQTLRACAASVRDISMQTADAVEAILGGLGTLDNGGPGTLDHALSLFCGDSGGVPSGIHEAYWQVTTDVGACTAYLDMASAADVVDEHIHGKQRWDLLDFYGVLTVGAAAVTLPKKAGVRLAKYGTLWNKNYMHCSKAKTLKGIHDRRAERGHQRLGGEDLGYVRRMLTDTLPDVEGAARVCANAGLDAQGCLHLMRLWNTGYKLSMHNKVKRVLAA